MSGREKNAPRTPEEERALLRQLTRELHEAAQDARDAVRELNAAVAAAGPSMEARAEGACQNVLAQIQDIGQGCVESLAHFEQVVEDNTASAVRAIELNHARLTGFENPNDFGQFLGTQTAAGLMANENFIDIIANRLYRMIEDGVLSGVVSRKSGDKMLARSPLIQVGTKEDVDAAITAGVDVGTVIDLRGEKPVRRP